MNRILAIAAVALALCAPVGAHASAINDPANPDLNTKAGFLSVIAAAKEAGGPPTVMCNRVVCTSQQCSIMSAGWGWRASCRSGQMRPIAVGRPRCGSSRRTQPARRCAGNVRRTGTADHSSNRSRFVVAGT